MKTKRFYEPPKVVTMNLYTEGILCASGEPDYEGTVGFNSMSNPRDLTGLWD